MTENPFEKAADIMRTQGMTKGIQQDEGGRVCLYGAVSIALTGRPFNVCHHMDATRPIAEVLDRTAGDLFPDRRPKWDIGTAATINNHEDTTLEDCLLILKHAAAAWDEREGRTTRTLTT